MIDSDKFAAIAVVVLLLAALILLRRLAGRRRRRRQPRSTSFPLAPVVEELVADLIPAAARVAPPAVPAEAVDARELVKLLMYELPFTAGASTVQDNLVEVARATMLYYEHGATGEGALPVGVTEEAFTSTHGDVGAVAGYLSLEQRLGRVAAQVSPEHVATLLMGALAARALGQEITGENDQDSLEFAAGMVIVLIEGITADSRQDLGWFAGT